MQELIYYAASSLDGYIADIEGGVDWLQIAEVTVEDHGYGDFYKHVDSLIMGRTTYEQILGFGEWPYPDRPCWVMTSSEISVPENSNIVLTRDTPADVLKEIRSRGYGRTWLVGGGKVAASFFKEGLITEFYITLIPILLVEGIPLLSGAMNKTSLDLLESRTFKSGILQLRYGCSGRSGGTSED